jgi:hypothetical protein
VDTLGYPLALAITSAKKQDRVRQLAAALQAATGETDKVA